MFVLTVKPGAHPVEVTSRFRSSDKVAVIMLRPGEAREFEVSTEIERTFKEVASEPLLGTRAGEEAVP